MAGSGDDSPLGQDSTIPSRPHQSRIGPEAEATLADLARDGASASRVGKALSVPEGTAKRWMWERGLAKVAKQVRAERRLAPLRLHASAELEVAEIRKRLAADGLNVDSKTLKRLLDANDLPYKPRRSLPDEVVATIERDLVAGISHRDIAKAAGVETSDVKRIAGYAVRQGRVKSRKADRPWTEADVRRLVQLASAGTTHRMIAGLLDRSPGAVTAKLFILKEEAVAPKRSSRRGRGHRWSPEDEATILSLKSDRLGLAAIAEATNRSPRAIKDRLQKLSGQAQRKWSKADRMELVRLHLADTTPADIAQAIGRSIQMVQVHLTRCRQQGLLAPIVHPWPEADVSTLLRLAREGKSDLEVAMTLGQPVVSVRCRAAKLHHEGLLEIPLRRERVPRAPGSWSETADARLLTLDTEGKSYAAIAEMMGRTKRSVKRRLYQLRRAAKLTRPARDVRQWSESDDVHLLALDAVERNPAAIAELTGRTPNAVKQRLFKLRRDGKLVRPKRHRGGKARWSAAAGEVADATRTMASHMLPALPAAVLTFKRRERRSIGRLNALAVSRLTEPGLYADGRGLYLQVSKGGGRSWIFRYRLNGRKTPRDMGLGPLHTVSLAEAREKARVSRGQLLADVDPIEERRSTRAQRASEAAKTRTIRDYAAPKPKSATDNPPRPAPAAVIGDDLFDRLRQRAVESSRQADEDAFKKSVRSFVRLHLADLAELKQIARTWNAVAKLLHDEGLSWDGKFVTGSQLRTIFFDVGKSAKSTPGL